MRGRKKIAILILITIILTSVYNGNLNIAVASFAVKVSNGKYIITSEKNLTAQYTGVSKKSVTSVNIPATVKINGQAYKVTSIKSNALKGNKKIKKLVVGENIRTIGKNAFYGCKNLKAVTIKTTNLSNSSVKAGSFKGLNSKAVITVPSSKLASYKKILKAKGLTGKKQTVKGKKTTDVPAKPVPEPTPDPNRDIPGPEEARFTLTTSPNSDTIIKDVNKYSIGDSIPMTAGFEMNGKLYGEWFSRTSTDSWLMCGACKTMFDDEHAFALHYGYGLPYLDGPCESVNYYFSDNNLGEKFTAWYWVADTRECKVSVNIHLSEGLSYKDGTLKAYRTYHNLIDNNAYQVKVDGQDVTLIFDDIKSSLVNPLDMVNYITVSMDATLNHKASFANTITSSMTYNYGTGDKTVDLGKATVYSSSLKLKNTNADGEELEGAEFELSQYKTVKSGNISTQKYVSIATGIKGDPSTVISGLGEGQYKLTQTKAPLGHKKSITGLVFNIAMEGKNEKLTTFSVTDSSGKAVDWDVDSDNGVVTVEFVNKN